METTWISVLRRRSEADAQSRHMQEIDRVMMRDDKRRLVCGNMSAEKRMRRLPEHLCCRQVFLFHIMICLVAAFRFV